MIGFRVCLSQLHLSLLSGAAFPQSPTLNFVDGVVAQPSSTPRFTSPHAPSPGLTPAAVQALRNASNHLALNTRLVDPLQNA